MLAVCVHALPIHPAFVFPLCLKTHAVRLAKSYSCDLQSLGLLRVPGGVCLVVVVEGRGGGPFHLLREFHCMDWV